MLHEIPLRQKIITMLAVMSGLFLVALDQTIVATALSAIVAQFNSFSSLSWIVTAYLLGSTITIPIAGKLSDLFGRRLILLIGVGLFTVTSFFSGSSQDITQLIIARAIQGVGAGIVMANAFTIVGDLFSPRERGRWQGFVGASFAVASVVGPLIGGFLTDQHMILGLISSWRWNFWLNVPIGITAFVLIWKYCPPIKHDKRPKVDYWGAGALAIALSSLILAVDNTGQIFSGLINNGLSLLWLRVILYSIAGIFGIAFVLIENKAKEATIPLNFFKNRTFTTIMIVAVLFGAAFLGAIIYLTQFNQQVFNATATSAGLMLLPMIGGLTITSVLSGQIVTKTGKYKKLFIGGLVLATVSVFFLTTLGPSSPYWHEAIIMALVGIGLGTGMPIMNLAVQNEFAQKDLGVATSASQLFRGLGSTIGVAIMGAMLTAGVTAHLGNISGDPYIKQISKSPVAAQMIGDGSANTVLNLNTKDVKDEITKGFTESMVKAGIPDDAQKLIKQRFDINQKDFSARVSSAFSKGLNPIFYLSAGLMVIATLVGFGVKERELRGSMSETPGLD